MRPGSHSRRQLLADESGQLGLFDATTALRSPGRVEALPSTARQLVDVIGLEATIDLVKFFGGDELDVTTTAIGGSSRLWELLMEVIGEEKATLLVRNFGGTRLYVPTCRAALLAERNRAIVAAIDKGEPFDSVRRRYGMTRRHLWRVLKRGDGGP